ncbi:nuclear transport factor 2 family protein [Massilia aerilata]|uniref:Nuclear transport factor 2 family protein n=1 Tax=Massilia aerilata TaxID=453817 RepID=A0ABW0RUM1_9BURK
MTDTTLKQAALDFLQMTAAGQVEQAFERYAGPQFRHHNPYFASDAASIKAGMLENAARFSDMLFEVQRAIADGAMVAVHSRARMTPDGLDVAIVHILRFEEGRIAEMWDIGQAQPDPMPNERGMF